MAESRGIPRSWGGSLLLAARSLLWAVLLPGLFAGLVPWRYFGLSQLSFQDLGPREFAGFLVILPGVLLLGACIVEFARSGRGTLAPVDPPKELVVQGLYRFVRNPMYLSVSLIVLGEALAAASLPLLLYWAVWFLVANLFVIGYEEPNLRQRFGASYDAYTRRVGRWLPRRPREGED